jgi:DNA-binding response OmpR family regulator
MSRRLDNMSMTAYNPHVLVVDDAPITVDGVRLILEADGYRVSIAGDGTTALDIMRSDEPDAVLLGIVMPGMSGREVCRRMREMSNTVRIIYWSGSVDRADSKTLAQLGREADEVIGKLASIEEILAKVARVLNLAE